MQQIERDQQGAMAQAAGPVRAVPCVLVVDDDPFMRDFLRVVLLQDRYEVLLARDGAEAIGLARERLPDLVLLDVRMTDMDGHAVCRALKAEVLTRDIPVIFLSSLHEVADVTRGFELGAVDYVTKPFTAPLVLARVRTHLALYARRRSLEGMFRDVVEFAPDAFVLFDEAGKIMRINARAEQLFGHARQELVGQPIQSLLSGQRLEGMRDFVLRTSIPHSGLVLTCRRKDGGEFPADISISPLQTSHGRWLMATVRDVSQRQRDEQDLRHSRQRLREMAARSEAALEEERRHIAREVHDELGQILTALRMDVAWTQMRYRDMEPQLAAKIADMKTLIDRGIQAVRDVARNLRPTALDMGLVPAIEWLASETMARHDLTIRLDAEVERLTIAPERAVVLFRIVQESITNAVRYAQASELAITLRVCEDRLHLSVCDNGVGFDPVAGQGGQSFGLLGMHERALTLGGALTIDSAPDRGTRIGVEIPLEGNWKAS